MSLLYHISQPIVKSNWANQLTTLVSTDRDEEKLGCQVLRVCHLNHDDRACEWCLSNATEIRNWNK